MHIPTNRKTKMSKGYTFNVVPIHVYNRLIKTSRINHFGKKINRRSKFKARFNTTKHHHFNISKRPQNAVNQYPERCYFRKKKLAPGSRSHAWVSTTSTPSRNKSIGILSDSINSFHRIVKQN